MLIRWNQRIIHLDSVETILEGFRGIWALFWEFFGKLHFFFSGHLLQSDSLGLQTFLVKSNKLKLNLLYIYFGVLRSDIS